MADVETLESALLTIAEVAALFRKSTRTINRWIADGEFPIPVRPIAGRNYVRAVDIEEYLGRAVNIERVTS